MVLGVAACANDVASSETASESSSTTAQIATLAGSASETSDAPIGWPRDWYGDHYEDPGFTIGLEYQEPILFIQLQNMRLDSGTVTIERFGYEAGNESSQWTLATSVDGDALRVIPPGGEWNTLYPGADKVLVRPGAGCNELLVEVHGLPAPYEPVLTTRWQRGRLCVVDPYDESVAEDEWLVDVCPASVLDCDG